MTAFWLLSFLLQFQLTAVLFTSCTYQFYRHREQFHNQPHQTDIVILPKETISRLLPKLFAFIHCLVLVQPQSKLDQVCGLPENNLIFWQIAFPTGTRSCMNSRANTKRGRNEQPWGRREICFAPLCGSIVSRSAQDKNESTSLGCSDK